TAAPRGRPLKPPPDPGPPPARNRSRPRGPPPPPRADSHPPAAGANALISRGGTFIRHRPGNRHNACFAATSSAIRVAAPMTARCARVTERPLANQPSPGSDLKRAEGHFHRRTAQKTRESPKTK